jgi:hypothetical protein
MSVGSVLKKVGHEFLVVLGVAENVATAATPIIALAEPQLVGIYTTTLSFVKGATATLQAAGKEGTLTPTQVAALASQLTPQLIPYLTSIGVSNPTTAQVQKYLEAFIAGLESFELTETTSSVPPASA